METANLVIGIVMSARHSWYTEMFINNRRMLLDRLLTE